MSHRIKSRQNSLVITNRADSIHCREKLKSRVTIVVGIICEDAIVLASDSQTTYSPISGASQRLDTPKISTLELFNDVIALVAQAGNATLSGRAVEILTDLAKGKEIKDYRALADMAQESVRKVKQELREQNLGCSMEELHEHIQKNELNFELMIAHYHDSKPYIFTLNFAVGIASKSPHPFLAIGCGSAVATYILGWFKLGSKTPFQHAQLAAIYAIEEVKKVDPYCGGKTRVAIIAPKMTPPNGKSLPEIYKIALRAEHNEYVEALEKIDTKAKAEWASRMDTVLFEVNEIMLQRAKALKQNHNA